MEVSTTKMEVSTPAAQEKDTFSQPDVSNNTENKTEAVTEECAPTDNSALKQVDQMSAQNGCVRLLRDPAGAPSPHASSPAPHPVENGASPAPSGEVAPKQFPQGGPNTFPPSYSQTMYRPGFDMQQQHMQHMQMMPQNAMQHNMQPLSQHMMHQQQLGGMNRISQSNQQPMPFHQQQLQHQQMQQQMHIQRLQFQRQQQSIRYMTGSPQMSGQIQQPGAPAGAMQPGTPQMSGGVMQPGASQMSGGVMQPGAPQMSGVMQPGTPSMSGGVMRLIPAPGPACNGLGRMSPGMGMTYRPAGYGVNPGPYPQPTHNGTMISGGGIMAKPIQRLFTENYDQDQMTTREISMSDGRRGGLDSGLGSCNEETRLSAAGSESHDGDTVSSSRMDGASESLADSDSFMNASNHSVADSSTPLAERKGHRGSSGAGAGSALKKKPAGSSVVYERMLAMGDEPGRGPFVQQLFAHMRQACTPICSLPIICKSTIDLFKLYLVVKERGGMQEVTRLKKWRDVSALVGQGPSSSAGFAVKRNYCKYLFSYECKYDLGGIDPSPILAAMEAAIKKDSRKPSSKRYLDIGDDINDPDLSMNDSMDGNQSFNFSSSFSLPNSALDYLGGINSTSDGCGGSLNHSGYPMGGSYHQGGHAGAIQGDHRMYNGSANNLGHPNTDRSSHNGRTIADPSGVQSVKLEEDEFGRSDRNSYDPVSWLQTNQSSSKRLDFNLADAGMATAQANSIRRNITFPQGCIESTKPVVIKKKRLHNRHLGEIDMKKVQRILTSGQLAECTWALDVLCVISREDSTQTQISFTQHPRLLSLLIEHTQRCLQYLINRNSAIADCIESKELALPSCFPSESLPNDARECENIEQLSSKVKRNNYTYKTRNGKLVKIHKDTENPEPKVELAMELDCVGGSHIVDHMNDTIEQEFSRSQFYGKYFSGMKIESTFDDDSLLNGILECDQKLEPPSKHQCGLKNGPVDIGHEIKLESDQNSSIKIEKHPETLSSDDLKTANNPDESFTVNSVHNNSSFSLTLDNNMPMERFLFSSNQIEKLRSDCSDLSDDWFLCPSDSSMQTFAVWDDVDVEVHRRITTIFCILRNASFSQVNHSVLARDLPLLRIISRFMRLSATDIRCCCNKYDTESSSECDQCWARCADTFSVLREHSLVLCANIAGKLELSDFTEDICAPIIDSLLHWFLSSNTTAVDSAPGCRLPLRRLALETLAKLSVTDSNVDLVLATRPYARIMLMLTRLVDELRVGPSTNQIIREISLGLLYRLVRSDPSVARTAALYQPSLPILIEFIESADKANKLELYSLDASSAPDINDTSTSQLVRAAETLQLLIDAAQHDPVVLRNEQRLLTLAMSTTLDDKVTAVLAHTLATFTVSSRTIL